MYDCIIIGGGIAGLQCAIQLGRYQHEVLVIDANDGRSTLCRSYHNILGWPAGVSGPDLRRLGRLQATQCGVQFLTAEAKDITTHQEGFTVHTSTGGAFTARAIMVATGVKDNLAPIPGLLPTLGVSIYVCPDCDGYECAGKKTVIIGSGDVGASMALELHYFTDDVLFINHDSAPVKGALQTKLSSHGIRRMDVKVVEILSDNGQTLDGIVLETGESIQSEKGFVAFGGNKVESDLLTRLGAQMSHSRHVDVNPRTKMTSIPGIFAAGDVVAHSEQVSIAMGDGSQAAIWIHKLLLGYAVPSQSEHPS